MDAIKTITGILLGFYISPLTLTYALTKVVEKKICPSQNKTKIKYLNQKVILCPKNCRRRASYYRYPNRPCEDYPYTTSTTPYQYLHPTDVYLSSHPAAVSPYAPYSVSYPHTGYPYSVNMDNYQHPFYNSSPHITAPHPFQPFSIYHQY